MSGNKPARISTFGSQVTSVISVALTLVILGVITGTVLVAHRVTDSIRTNMSVTVQAVPGADHLSLNRIKRLISARPEVESWKFMSADMVLAQEAKSMGDDIASLLDENPYSAEFEIHLKAGSANAAAIGRLTKALRADSAVSDILSDVSVVEDVNRSFSRMTLILAIIGGVLLIISVVLMNATISLSIYSRRFLIRTMRLVGATPGFIRRPFVRAGFINGLIAGAAASILLAAAQAYVLESEPWTAPYLSWTDALIVYGVIILAGIIICPAAAWLATTRYLRRNYDSLYRK